MAGLLAELSAGEWSADRLNDVATVFLGGSPGTPSAQWTVARAAAVRLVRVLSQTLADPVADVRVGFTVLAEEPAALVGTEGVWATGSTAPDHPRWVNPSQAAWLAHLATNQLHVGWQVARRRYLGIAHEGLQVVTDAAIDSAEGMGVPGARP